MDSGESAGTNPEPWWTMETGTPEWLAEVVRSGRESMRDLLDALGREEPPSPAGGATPAPSAPYPARCKIKFGDGWIEGYTITNILPDAEAKVSVQNNDGERRLFCDRVEYWVNDQWMPCDPDAYEEDGGHYPVPASNHHQGQPTLLHWT